MVRERWRAFRNTRVWTCGKCGATIKRHFGLTQWRWMVATWGEDGLADWEAELLHEHDHPECRT